MACGDYLEQFIELNVNKSKPPEKVHKPCMLLAVIDLAERGVLKDNNIRYDDTLEVFAEYAKAARPGESLEPNWPFFHLRTEPFWQLQPARQPQDEHRRTHGAMMGRSASLCDELYRDMVAIPNARAAMRDALIGRWFPERRENVEAVVASRRISNEYETRLRDGNGKPTERPDGDSRSQAFRKLVLQAYDYRCAATGWRIIVPPVESLVDAAHLIPFNLSKDDRPSNGIALSPTFHRALDRHLIAPAPNMKWRISKAVDRRIPDNRPLTELEGQRVIFDGKRQHHPSPEALKWRIDHLLTP